MTVIEIQKIIQMYYPPSEISHLCAKEIYARLKEDGHGE